MKFRNGVYVNNCNTRRYRRLRISAGPLRGQYVDVLVLQAKLGRPLAHGMTVEHLDGNSLNPHPDNLAEISQSENSKAQWERNKYR